MKNFKLFTLACTLTLFTTQLSFAQNFSDLNKSPMDGASYPSSYKISDKDVMITYGRPQLKGRALSKLAPNGEVWRTGANEAAQITFYKQIIAGKTTIEPGTYSLFTIPGEKEWTIILSRDVNVWGSYSYNKKKDVARFMAPVTIGKKSIEAFSIAFKEGKNGIDMYLGWDTAVVKASFKVEKSNRTVLNSKKMKKQ
jgi:hypothetical protein